MGRLTIEGLCKGWDFPVIDDLSIEVEEGEFFVIVGPSGIGKTSLLRLIAGLETPDRGRIVVGDRDVTKLPPYRRRVAMTFESYALYPHLTVFENIASPLRARGTNRDVLRRKVEEVAALLRISELLERNPGEISGGQKQRTALGRTLVADPEVFLLDEPISHLDAKIRYDLRGQFHTLEELRRVATVYVTHDYAEALSLGDRIGVMGDGGKLVQVAGPRELFETPVNIFVAQHLGQPTINVIQAEFAMENGVLVARAAGGSFALAIPEPRRALFDGRSSSAVTLGIRPQHIRPSDEALNGVQIEAVVEIFESFGSTGIMIAESGGVKLTVLTDPERHFGPGESVTLAIADRKVHFFDSETGRNLVM